MAAGTLLVVRRGAAALAASPSTAVMFIAVLAALSGGAKPDAPTPPGEMHRIVEDIITSNKIVVFSRKMCKESAKVKEMLEDYGLAYAAYELDDKKDGDGIAATLAQGNFQPTVNAVQKFIGATSVMPAIFVKGKAVSKNALSISHKTGELEHWTDEDEPV